ncbi:RNA/RNP complex-1-interacting phosphatase homolog isoform X1 [Drosophila bipectinata]|uniref:RNA/RNP complex-1-interacting phosphatase homolog isoform X1 n=1 Tax=Drosophila bipectinata TaxID=42026 RepID=UPI001C8A04CB|nr:RNA/RNP complex-1-interacting phosphatase homolog [Drosophila bipectinata]XP_043066604.1 RNA/RNP complex-1-interacting phosphatase homolog [Drosophila bipectinata]
MKTIPDRWLEYSPIGERVPGTRFIAFKVPLREHVSAKVSQEKLRLAPESLMEAVPDLGLIIDLTNTSRYYNPESFTSNDVEHKKLMIPGKETPSKDLAEKFCRLVANFLEDNADNDKLIGVHCTHGVNRTGYLICYFMITKMNKSPSESIETFAAARGHEIERQNYMSSLRKLSGKEPKKDRSTSKETSVESDYIDDHYDNGHKSHHSRYESNDRSHYQNRNYQNYQNYQRGRVYNQRYNSRGNYYNGSYQNNWRGRRGYPSNGDNQNRYYPRDNHYYNNNYNNRYVGNNRDYNSGGDWRNSRRTPYHKPYYQNNGWSQQKNWRQDRDDRQQYHRSSNSSNQRSWRDYSRDYSKRDRDHYDRDDSKRSYREKSYYKEDSD